MKTTAKVIEGIISRGYVLESEINLLKLRANRGDFSVFGLFDETAYNGMISQEQTQKGLNWLMDQWKTPAGKERKNNPFGAWEQRILANFSHFEFIDLYGAGNSYVTFYLPVYRVVDTEGRAFDYYVQGGEVRFY